MKNYIITLLMLLSTLAIYAQDQRAVDSLTTLIQEAQHDTTLAAAYIELSSILYVSNLDTVIPLCKKAKQIAERNLAQNPSPALEKKYLTAVADAVNNIGYIYLMKGDIHSALESYYKSLRIREDIGDKKGVAVSLNNIGRIYDDQGDIPKALEYSFMSLKIKEELGDKKGIGYSLNNIGLIYFNQGDIPEALESFNKCLGIREEIGDKKGIAQTLNNIGVTYYDQGDIFNALEYYHKSLKIREDIGDKKGVAVSLNNLGRIYENQEDFPKALECFYESLKIGEDIGDKTEIAYTSNSIATVELSRGALADALVYGSRSLQLAQELGSTDLIARNARLLSSVAKLQGNYKEALEMYELHILMHDSIKNEETQKATIRQQTKYEFEKAQLIKEQEEQEAARVAAEIVSRRDNLQYSVVLIGLLAIAVLVAMLGRLSLPGKMAEGIIFFSFLILFEFLLVLADPYIEGWSGGAPGIKLLFNAGIAALIFPTHAFFESKLKGRLVKINTAE